MELQPTQQRMLTRYLVALLIASGMSVQETRAVSLFSVQKAAVVAPVAPGFVDFVKENQELTAITSVVLAGVISYAIYQMWLAPKTPISRIVQKRRARFDDYLAQQRGIHRAAQSQHLDAMSEDNKNLMVDHFRRTHAQVAEGLVRALVAAIGYDESADSTIDFRGKLNQAMDEFQAEILKNRDGKAAIAADQAIVKRTCNEMCAGLSQEDKDSCAFLEASLQEYVELLVHMKREEHKYKAELIAYFSQDAVQHPKEEATLASRDVKVEQERLKKLAEAQKSPSQNSDVDLQEDVVHNLIFVDWQNTSVEDVFKRGREQFQGLQKLFPPDSQEHALFVEGAVRGARGIFAVMGAVFAHKICEIVCGKGKRIDENLYEELFHILRETEIRAFNDVNFDFARDGLRDVLCQKLEQNAASKVQQDALMALLVSYRDFIRETRAQLDDYLTKCGCRRSDNGSPCTAALSSQAYEGIEKKTPLLNWPYVVVEAEKVPAIIKKKPRALRIKSDDEDPKHPDSKEGDIPPVAPVNDWSSASAFSSMSYSSETSATPAKSTGRLSSFSSSYRSSGSSSGSSAGLMGSSSAESVASETLTMAASTTAAASSASSTAAPTVHASQSAQAHKNEQVTVAQEVGTLTNRFIDAVHAFTSAAKNDRPSKKEALIKDVLDSMHGFGAQFVDEAQYKSAEDSLRKQLESELNLVMKQDEIDEPEILRKVDTAIRNVLGKN